MTNFTERLTNAVEVAAVVVADQYFAAWTVALALAGGFVLPDMPLLKHTYLAFVFVLILLLWVRLRGETWADFGLIVPRRWALYFGLGVLLAIADLVLDGVVRSISTPLIVSWTGADPHLDQKTFAELKGNLPLFLVIIPSIWLFAAFGEEFLFRGYLLTRLAQIFGGSRAAWALAVVGQAAAFGLAHFYQGPVGMFPIAVGAVLNGAVSVVWGRNLWPVIVAHGLVDTLGFTFLYLGIPIS
jgi:membrane protease YdiL (CAAX protease family)